jgi:hypothetical protein
MHFHNSTQTIVTAQIISLPVYSDPQIPLKTAASAPLLYLSSLMPFLKGRAVSFSEILERQTVPIPLNEFNFPPCPFHTSFSSFFFILT